MSKKVWFITGASRGFGRQWATAALERGDHVAATARNTSSLEDLVATYGDAVLPIALDVTDRDADFAAVKQAYEHFGRIDVVINNAGYGHFGVVEELSEEDLRMQMETNFFGAAWITQAALPFLREQNSGHIIMTSSIGGITAFPGGSAYHASKFAIEGFTQSLAGEVAEFGIHTTLVEPGSYATDWAGPSAKMSKPLPAYDAFREASQQGGHAWRQGNPEATRQAILAIVDAQQPPQRIFLGVDPLPMATAEYEARLAEWNEWKSVSESAQG